MSSLDDTSTSLIFRSTRFDRICRKIVENMGSFRLFLLGTCQSFAQYVFCGHRIPWQWWQNIGHSNIILHHQWKATCKHVGNLKSSIPRDSKHTTYPCFQLWSSRWRLLNWEGGSFASKAMDASPKLKFSEALKIWGWRLKPIRSRYCKISYRANTP